MKNAIRTASFLFLALLLLAANAAADTLELRNGRVINGRYLGGTQQQVRFEVNGKVELFAVGDILAITFEGEPRLEPSGKPAPASTPATQPAASPAPSSTSQLAEAPAPAAQATPAAKTSVTIPAGTRILVRMIDGVDSATNKVGDRFRASLDENLYVGDTLVAVKGTDLIGRLAEAQEAGRLAGKSQLKLELTDITIDTRSYPVISGEYEISGKGRGGDTAKKVGGGAAIGAIIGVIAGGGKGAAIGAGVGAAAGTTVQVLTKGEQVRVPSETLLEFTIQQPVTVTPTSSAPR